MSYFAKLVDRKDVGAICGVHLQFIKFKQQSNKTIFIIILFSIPFHFLPLLLIFGLRNDEMTHIPLFELDNANYKQRPSGWSLFIHIVNFTFENTTVILYLKSTLHECFQESYSLFERTWLPENVIISPWWKVFNSEAMVVREEVVTTKQCITI